MARTTTIPTTPSASTAGSELLTRFADHMVRVGIALVPAEALARLVAMARTQGVSEVLIGVLVDPTEPGVVRERAFSKIAGKVMFPTTRVRTVCQSTRQISADTFSGWSRTIDSTGPPRRAPYSSQH